MRENCMIQVDREMKDDMLPEYDFTWGVRGKFAAQFAKGTNLVLIAPDLMATYPTQDAVNDALRRLIQIERK